MEELINIQVEANQERILKQCRDYADGKNLLISYESLSGNPFDAFNDRDVLLERIAKITPKQAQVVIITFVEFLEHSFPTA